MCKYVSPFFRLFYLHSEYSSFLAPFLFWGKNRKHFSFLTFHPFWGSKMKKIIRSWPFSPSEVQKWEKFFILGLFLLTRFKKENSSFFAFFPFWGSKMRKILHFLPFSPSEIQKWEKFSRYIRLFKIYIICNNIFCFV